MRLLQRAEDFVLRHKRAFALAFPVALGATIGMTLGLGGPTMSMVGTKLVQLTGLSPNAIGHIIGFGPPLAGLGVGLAGGAVLWANHISKCARGEAKWSDPYPALPQEPAREVPTHERDYSTYRGADLAQACLGEASPEVEVDSRDL